MTLCDRCSISSKTDHPLLNENWAMIEDGSFNVCPKCYGIIGKLRRKIEIYRLKLMKEFWRTGLSALEQSNPEVQGPNGPLQQLVGRDVIKENQE